MYNRNQTCNQTCNQTYNQTNQTYNQTNNYPYNTRNHVHELTGSTEIVNECNECHNHRFCTMSGDAIPMGNSHVHEIKFKTDYADGHQHEFCGKSSTAINVGNGKHVHFAKATTESEDGHKHEFQVASLINEPTEFKNCD